MNFCGQPGSCGCAGFDCGVFHATRLYAFTQLLGANGFSADICGGPQAVPTAVKTALTESIDLACMKFNPPAEPPAPGLAGLRRLYRPHIELLRDALKLEMSPPSKRPEGH